MNKPAIWWAFCLLARIDDYLYNRYMSTTVTASNGGELKSGGDFVGNDKVETTYNYGDTRETIESVTALLEELKQTNPLLSQAAEMLFKEFDRRETRIDALISENRELWERLHQLENALTIANKNNDSSLIRERVANEKIETMQEDIANCPSMRMKAAVISLLIFALVMTPTVSILGYLVYTG